jgi:hypothetical protein
MEMKEHNLLSSLGQDAAMETIVIQEKVGRPVKFKSVYHHEIAQLMKEKDESVGIFGQSWREVLGFFAPYGTRNCFWERLKKSPSFKHLFVFRTLENLRDRQLSDDHAVPVAVSDVDAAVNTSALVCALLLSIPCSIMTNTSPDMWQDWMGGNPDWNGKEWVPCMPSGPDSLYSDYCVNNLRYQFTFLYLMTMVSFYSALCTLITSVFYYMCRPSESSNCSSLITLMEAYTLEVRHRIRKERAEQSGATSEVKPDVLFASPNEEMEVFMKANFLANNEMEEQKNQTFYMWYRSEMRVGFLGRCIHSLFLLQLLATVALSLRVDFFQLSELKY